MRPGSRVLVADDDALTRRLLEATLVRAGHTVQLARDGREAWAALQAEDAPGVALLDWYMPGMDGPDLCRRVRERGPGRPYTYLVLLTAHRRDEHLVAGLEAGADEFLHKPVDPAELRARLGVARRLLELESQLGEKVRHLEAALARVNTLEGLLPICMHCKRIRPGSPGSPGPNGEQAVGQPWESLENYIEGRSAARFTHSLCPTCLQQHYPEG